jgi:hypothetical protein
MPTTPKTVTAQLHRNRQKFPVLEYIFNKLTENGTKGLTENHTFTLKDVSEGYAAAGTHDEPASISNTILDLTRKDLGIASRLPQSIIQYGYDLRKKTGKSPTGKSYAGEFVYVGVGNVLHSWHKWAGQPDQEVVIPNKIPEKITKYLRKDEGALFSAIDYCDALSLAIYGLHNPDTIIRVQNPMKWQPNEIDGLYFSDFEGVDTLFPVEAKALSTRDDINLEQMLGGYLTLKAKTPGVNVIPLGIQMNPNGMKIGVFKLHKDELEIDKYIQVTFDNPIVSWQTTRKIRLRPMKAPSAAFIGSLFPDK